MKIDGLCKEYVIGKKAKTKEKKAEPLILHAVDNVSFDVYKGEILGVVGESGCGKSTLGRCVMRLVDITRGDLYYKDDNIAYLNYKQMKPYRSNIQMIFQNPYSSFNSKKTIGKNISDVAKFYKMDKKEYDEKISELLSYIGMTREALEKLPGEFSGGQLQRLAIIRALLLNPEFIVADEPVSALDVSVQAQILNLIQDLKKQYNTTMMFISHELTVVQHVCDRVAVMYLGNLVEIGTSKQLFGNTKHPYTKALISAKPKELPEQKSNRVMLEGEVPSAINPPKGCKFHTRCPYVKAGVCDIEVPQLVEVEPGHKVACHLWNEIV